MSNISYRVYPKNMNAKKVLEWINDTIDMKNPEWFLLPYDTIEEIMKFEFFDYDPKPETVGASGSIGVLRTIPIRIGYKMNPCYGENHKVHWYVE